MLNSITVRAIVFVLGFLGLVGSFVLVLYALTPVEDRTAFATHLADVLPAVVAGIPAVLAMLFAKDARKASQSNSESLNGGLEPRIAAVVNDVLDSREAR